MFKWYYLISFFWAAVPQLTFGNSGDTLKSKLPNTPPVLRVGIDLSRIFMSATQKDFLGGEFSLDYQSGKLIYEVHAGFAHNEQMVKNYIPSSSGVFGSLGLSKNLFNDSKNVLSFGGRIAMSQYQYQARKIDIGGENQGEGPLFDLPKSNCNAIWFEAVAAMRAQIWAGLMMGFELRVKPRIHSRIGPDVPYYIPGYGLYKNNTSLGFNYYLYYQISTKK